MPEFRKLPDAALDTIAAEIGKRLGSPAFAALAATFAPAGGGAAAVAAAPTLNETVEEWTLGASSLLEPTDNLARLANPTGRWHHQIKSGGKAIAFARSLPLGPEPEDWSLRQVSHSALSEAIDTSIRWIDSNITDDSEVRLLVVPAYNVTALWLFDNQGGRVVVCSAPFIADFQVNSIYSSKDFLDILRSAKHIKGLS